jgi:serine phosphatase RsbU (regulator of sigma subunit)/anti-sigma regulatory factor (Ser/Thr protein kinase)
MTTFAFWRRNNKATPVAETAEAVPSPAAPVTTAIDLDIAPNDPLLTYLQSAPGVVEVDKLNLASQGLAQLREAGVALIVPLVSQGELVGMINLGPRLSEQEYSSDDRKLLADLAAQAAPAVRVAQLARQQQIEARERERIEQELRVARLIQQTLLPQSLPELADWQVAVHWQPARAVGGDFYDFIELPDGRMAFIIADVTDKGVPAALVMATTRTLLRAAAERLASPGEVLERVNELLCPDIPERMFVTCLYAVLDPATGRLHYANAGHDVPYLRTAHGMVELRATGMPLGLLPGMHYEEKEAILNAGDEVLFYSDGLVEAHDPVGEMFGFPRLKTLIGDHDGSASLIDYLLSAMEVFTGAEWEQEDDVTLVTLKRRRDHTTGAAPGIEEGATQLTSFTVPSAPGNERIAMERVAQVVAPLLLETDRLNRLKTAVAEATMNAMEHGNHYRDDQPVTVAVDASDEAVIVRIVDHGGDQEIGAAETPDLEAKLAGLQTPRGWGLFLIQNMVDELNSSSDGVHHTIELTMRLSEGENHA